MAFELPDLPYPHDALAANGMSKETLEFHHDIHHKAYVDNGNKAIAGTEWEGKSVEEIVKGTYQKGAVAQSGIFNNASQHWNHSQFWQMMSPSGGKMPGRAREPAEGRLRLGRQVQGGVRHRRRRPVRLGLGVAGQGRGRRAEGHQDRERRQPALLRPDRAARLRRVGAFLLHRLPQQAAGLSHELPRQAGELGERRLPALTRKLGRAAAPPSGRGRRRSLPLHALVLPLVCSAADL